MDKEQEETVLRITARYVAEERAGKRPRLSDYLIRYPQYADAITDFVTYYSAAEVEAEEINVMPFLSESSRVAMERAWERVLQSDTVLTRPANDAARLALRAQAGQDAGSNRSLTTLLMAENKQRLSLSQLAAGTGLSVDIIEKLEQRIIDASTIPQEVLKRLGEVLQQPLNLISMYLADVEHRRMHLGIAESPVSYQFERQNEVQAESFRDAVEQSVQLPDEQKDAWRDILMQEGLL